MGNPQHTGNAVDVDPDCDCLSTFSEALYGTDPLNPDTDVDGYPDGVEIFYKTNPKDLHSYPTQHPIITILLAIPCAIIVIYIILMHYRKP